MKEGTYLPWYTLCTDWLYHHQDMLAYIDSSNMRLNNASTSKSIPQHWCWSENWNYICNRYRLEDMCTLIHLLQIDHHSLLCSLCHQWDDEYRSFHPCHWRVILSMYLRLYCVWRTLLQRSMLEKKYVNRMVKLATCFPTISKSEAFHCTMWIDDENGCSIQYWSYWYHLLMCVWGREMLYYPMMNDHSPSIVLCFITEVMLHYTYRRNSKIFNFMHEIDCIDKMYRGGSYSPYMLDFTWSIWAQLHWRYRQENYQYWPLYPNDWMSTYKDHNQRWSSCSPLCVRISIFANNVIRD